MNKFDKLIQKIHKTEKFLGSAKFAVAIILLFASVLIYGTFMESYHGTDYANRHVYKHPLFFLIQFFMFLSILLATLQRLPAKRRLYGFYVLHLGLLILFAGSFITYYSGIDGTLTLPPNSPNRTVALNSDELEIRFPTQGIKLTTALPYTSGKVKLNKIVKREGLPLIELKEFYPFSEEKLVWQKTEQAFPSSQYFLSNDRFGEEVTLSSHPESPYPSTQTLGLLNMHYMPQKLYPCFQKNPKSKLVVWDILKETCLIPEEQNRAVQKTKSGKKFVVITRDRENYQFFPSLSPFPVTDKLKIREDAPLRIFSLELFEKKPHLFLFGKNVSWFDKDLQAWQFANFEKNKLIELPWMGFTLKLNAHHDDKFPIKKPFPVIPTQDGGELISGSTRALKLKINDRSYWVKSLEGALRVNVGSIPVIVELRKKEVQLPYEINLDKFVMKTDPGTNNPAGYESYVTVFSGDKSEKHHVYMNHPLKHKNFTFYQASYFETNQGSYGSIFSVNFDPGRFWKYLGSLLLVLGSLWHFGVAKQKLSTKQTTKQFILEEKNA